MEKYKKYLPSQTFIRVGGIALALIIVFLLVLFVFSREEIFSSGSTKNKIPLSVGGQTILGVIQKDTDGDGIADWEEELWGTNKNQKITFENMPDATYIENRKKELNIESSVNEKNLTETEKFAREFFSTYSALKVSGEVDDETIKMFSSALGQEIIDPLLLDAYTAEKAKIALNENAESKKKYYDAMQSLYRGYAELGIGDELELIGSVVVTGSSSGSADSSQISKLNVIAQAYRDFSKKAMELSVPPSLIEYHLRITNSANNTGISVENMGKVINDPIVGLSGLSQYQKYSDDLVSAVEALEIALSS